MSTSLRRIVAEDVNRLVMLEDPRISPDGAWVAFVHVSANPLEKGYQRNIWLAATDGSRVLQLTRSGKDSAPRWSPDGRLLAFVSGRSGKPQLYLLPVAAPGGEPRQLTQHPNGAASPAWSPDSTQLAYLVPMTADEMAREDRGETEPKPQDSLESRQRKERREEDEKNRFDPRLITRLPYRVGTSFLDEREQQIYVIATADGLEGDAAKPRRLTSEPVTHSVPEWSADGDFIYTTRARALGMDEQWRETNVYRIGVADASSTRLVDEEHFIAELQASPDGRYLACTRIVYDTIDVLPRLSLYPTIGGDPIDLNLELDRTAVFYQWTQNGAMIVAVATEGDHHLYHLHIDSRSFMPLGTTTKQIQGLSVSPYGSIAYVATTPTNPSELYFRANDEAPPSVLTRFNQPFLRQVQVQPTHELRFAAPFGSEAQAWYVLPVDYEAGQRYPLIVNIHGGPHLMWGPGTAAMWHEWQVQAGRGYISFYCNPRGSEGYGADFLRGLRGGWSRAMEDVLAGVEALITQGMVDTERMVVTGGSYGGYLTAWIISHSDRFKAAAAHRGVYNLLSFYGTSDIPTFLKNEMTVRPWDDPLFLWENSPVAHAHKIKTPLLILHAENDFRVPIEQGEQLFAYVHKSGGTVKMLRYPREGHEMTRSGEPAHRISSLNEMLNWFDTYCAP